MEMCYDGALVMPINYAVMDEEEMTYVEGGGTFSITLKKDTICWAIAAISGVATKAALKAIFAGMMTGIAVAIELGTAGWGTLLAGLVLYYGSSVAAAGAAAIVKNIAGKIYTGGDIKLTVVKGWLVPSFNWKV